MSRLPSSLQRILALLLVPVVGLALLVLWAGDRCLAFTVWLLGRLASVLQAAAHRLKARAERRDAERRIP